MCPNGRLVKRSSVIASSAFYVRSFASGGVPCLPWISFSRLWPGCRRLPVIPQPILGGAQIVPMGDHSWFDRRPGGEFSRGGAKDAGLVELVRRRRLFGGRRDQHDDCYHSSHAGPAPHGSPRYRLAAPAVSFVDRLAARKAPRRVGFSPDLGIAPVDGEVVAVCERAAQHFADAGAEVVEACPDFSEAIEAFQIIRALSFVTGMSGHLRDHRDKLKPEIIWNIEKGLALRPEEIAWATLARGRLYRSVAAFFETIHYRPRTAIVTSVEFDHAEMFADLAAVKKTFRQFVALIPPDGRLLACADDPNVREVSDCARCPIETYGVAADATWRGVVRGTDASGTLFEVRRQGEPPERMRVPLSGLQNLRNTLAVIAVARSLGLKSAAIGKALESFAGIKRRQEVRGIEGRVMVIDDFAHHPTAVRLTLEGIRDRYHGRRIWAVFEPRTNTSRRNVFQADYAVSFDAADRIIVAAVDHAERVPERERFSAERLVTELEGRGRKAMHIPGVESIVARLVNEAVAGDVVVVMSNGAFGGIHDKLLAAFRDREPQRQAEGWK